jgi:hypothetical protein
LVEGLETFRKHFESFADRYVLIGGTAATVLMEAAGLTVDLPESIKADLRRFLPSLSAEPRLSLKPFGLNTMTVERVVQTLTQVYGL